MIAHQACRETIDFGELLGRRQAILARLHDTGIDLSIETRHAHHVEFIEIVGRDGQEADALEEAATGLGAAGIAVSVVSAGSTPTALRSARGTVTEERPGTYIFGDAIQVGLGSMPAEAVALTVAATVISTEVDGQFVVDAGAKVLSKDTAAYLDGHGLILGWPEARLTRLNDYHGIAEVPAGSARPVVGEVVSIMPNHVCPVVNLVDELVMVRAGEIVGRWPVDARGRNG